VFLAVIGERIFIDSHLKEKNLPVGETETIRNSVGPAPDIEEELIWHKICFVGFVRVTASCGLVKVRWRQL